MYSENVEYKTIETKQIEQNDARIGCFALKRLKCKNLAREFKTEIYEQAFNPNSEGLSNIPLDECIKCLFGKSDLYLPIRRNKNF